MFLFVIHDLVYGLIFIIHGKIRMSLAIAGKAKFGVSTDETHSRNPTGASLSQQLRQNDSITIQSYTNSYFSHNKV